MNFILFHVGNELPSHITNCIKQIQYTNPTRKIYFITNLNVEIQNVDIVKTQDLQIPDIGIYYKNADPLWRTSAQRLFYIEDFLSKTNIEDVIHFDNDILVYENIDTIEKGLKQFDFLMTSHFKTQFVFGFSYIKSAKSLTKLNQDLIQLLRLGEHKLKEFTHDMPHEMRLLWYVNEQNNNKLISKLPILPHGENFKIFNCCFDPSTYGKHLGGSHEHGPHNPYFVKTKKWTGTESRHDIGRAIINEEITIDFFNKPVILDKIGNEYKLFNLHIHTKDLKRWMFQNI